MRTLEDCSGNWVGIWTQFGIRGHMRLQLSFSGGSAEGHGSDDTGGFVVVGSYERSFTVELAKAYSTHVFCYEGQWDGAMISGASYQLGDNSNWGTFEMWPEGNDMNVESMEEVGSHALTHA